MAKIIKKYCNDFILYFCFRNAVMYGVFAFVSCFSPSLVNKLGPRASMMAAGLTYLFYIIQLLYLNHNYFYIASDVLGIDALHFPKGKLLTGKTIQK